VKPSVKLNIRTTSVKPRALIPETRRFEKTRFGRKVSAEQLTVFEGDETWYYKLHPEFEIIEWIIKLDQEFGNKLEYEKVDLIGRHIVTVKADKLSCHLNTMPDLFDALFFTCVETNYWEGPGPVSGNSSVVTIDKNKKDTILKTLQSIAHEMYPLIPEEVVLDWIGPIPE